jgi:hypothetical protein
MYRWMGG